MYPLPCVQLMVIVVSVGLVGASHTSDAMPEDPQRLADAAGMRCTRVEIRLPDEIVFFGAAGDTLRARVVTNLPAGTYTLRYAMDKQQMVVSPWPDASAIVRVSLSGPKKLGQRYQSCLRTMSWGIPLVVVDATDANVIQAGSVGNDSSSSANGTDPSTGIRYEVLSKTRDNLDLHARRMADTLFRMIMF